MYELTVECYSCNVRVNSAVLQLNSWHSLSLLETHSWYIYSLAHACRLPHSFANNRWVFPAFLSPALKHFPPLLSHNLLPSLNLLLLHPAHLIIWECAILVDGIHLRHFRANRFALQHRFLFAFRE